MTVEEAIFFYSGERAKKSEARKSSVCEQFTPIQIPVDDGWITMALALEKTPYNKYRANTIFDIESAYEKARLLMRQDNNWLKNADSH